MGCLEKFAKYLKSKYTYKTIGANKHIQDL